MRPAWRPPRAGCHGDTAVGVFNRQNVVNAVADHRDGLPVILPGLDEGLFLFRLDAAENGIFFNFLCKGNRVFRKRRGIDVFLGILHTGLDSDSRNRDRIVPGNNLDGDIRIREILENIFCVFFDDIGNDDRGERCNRSFVVLSRGNACGFAEQQDAVAFQNSYR